MHHAALTTRAPRRRRCAEGEGRGGGAARPSDGERRMIRNTMVSAACAQCCLYGCCHPVAARTHSKHSSGEEGGQGGAVVAVISAGLWVSSMRPRSRSHAAHSDWIRMHCLYITPTATQAGRGEGCAPQPWVLGSKAFCRHRPPQERCHIHHPRASSVGARRGSGRGERRSSASVVKQIVQVYASRVCQVKHG